MNKRLFLFLEFLVLWTYFCPQKIQAMAPVSKKFIGLIVAKKALLRDLARRAYSQEHLDAMIDTDVLHNQRIAIENYNAQRDEFHVQQIALEQAHCLVNSRESNDPECIWKNDVLAAFNDESIISKVYLFDGQAIGFVNYQIYDPWYQKALPKIEGIGPVCNIIHLAVDREHQNRGVGSVLLQSVINDCEKKAANRIALCTIGRIQEPKLIKFYTKFGFQITKIPCAGSPGDTGWTKRLGPHPVLVLAKKAIELLEELDDW
jgi:GNAT superfamily N-acetyltransferase